MSGGPIFLLGIQRGGTNQVLNILRSHPATCWPQGELHEVFRSRGLRAEGPVRALRKLRRYAPILLAAGDVLNPDRPPRRPGRLLAERPGQALRAGLEGSAAVNRESVAAYKAALAERGLIDPVAAPDRLVTKAMNYGLALVPDLLALWPDARFVGIIRDGRAVCEGLTVRGAGLSEASAAYAFVGRQLIDLEAAGLPLRTWRFEDLVADAPGTAAAIYAFCGLDRAATRGVCLQDKERIPKAGGGVAGMRKVAHYYSFEEMGRHMRADANAGALGRLPAAAAAEITARCRPVLAHFGYLDASMPEKAALTGAGPGH
jgi:hypothetical protein